MIIGSDKAEKNLKPQAVQDERYKQQQALVRDAHTILQGKPTLTIGEAEGDGQTFIDSIYVQSHTVRRVLVWNNRVFVEVLPKR